MIGAAIKPYLTWIKLGGLALAVALLVAGGCRWQANIDANKLAAKDRALSAAEASLRGSARALRAVNAEAQRRIRAAEEQRQAASEAAEVLADAYAEAQQAHAAEQAQWERAKRKPDCRALLATDLAKTCGVKAR